MNKVRNIFSKKQYYLCRTEDTSISKSTHKKIRIFPDII